jgi:DNA-binding response OmpR family regulator
MVDVLVVLDPADAGARRLIEALAAAEYDVRTVKSGGEADHAARAGGFDAIVLDPRVTGPEFIPRARRDHPAHALVAWAATSSSAAAADLLESGADEALHAGMSDRELVARTDAALRRAGAVTAGRVELALLRIDALQGEASWDGRDLGLTRREREVLEVLAASSGRTVRRERIYRDVWGYTMARGDRSVDVNVKRLRRKLAAAAGTEVQIATRPGVGYRLEVAESRAVVTTS